MKRTIPSLLCILLSVPGGFFLPVEIRRGFSLEVGENQAEGESRIKRALSPVIAVGLVPLSDGSPGKPHELSLTEKILQGFQNPRQVLEAISSNSKPSFGGPDINTLATSQSGATKPVPMLPVVMAAIPLPEAMVESVKNLKMGGLPPGTPLSVMQNALIADRLLGDVNGEVLKKTLRDLVRVQRSITGPDTPVARADQSNIDAQDLGIDNK